MRGAAFASTLTDQLLESQVAYTNFHGERWTYPLWLLISHLTNHQSYHRGQVTTLLRQLGKTASYAQSARTPVKPGKIYVGSFGMGDDAEQLKLALGYELTLVGFKVVDYEPQADSTITGLIVTRVEDGKPVKRVTVFLKDKKGKQLWNQDIGSTSNATRNDEQGIRQRAHDIARMLKQDSAQNKPTTTKGQKS